MANTKEQRLKMALAKIELVNDYITQHAQNEHWIGLLGDRKYFKLLHMSLPKAFDLWAKENIPL